MRGLPGSGKSYLAAQLLEFCGGERSNHVFSSDDYFMRNGKYIFNRQEVQYAHKFNQDNVLRAVRNGYSPVIVDNTNTQSWEMHVYIIMAVNHGYAVETLEPLTPWKFSFYQLIKKTVHGVPPNTIQAMLDRYEHNLTGQDIINQLKLTYPPLKHPPQPASRASRRVEPATEQLKAILPQENALSENAASLPPSIQPEPTTSDPQDKPSVPEIPEQNPSTSRFQLPIQSSFGNPGPLSFAYSTAQISLSQVADALQSISISSNPKICDPPPDNTEICDSAVSENVNNQGNSEDLINLSTPQDVSVGSLIKAEENSKQETDKLEWGNSDWAVVESKEERKGCTEQRQRWLLSDMKRGEAPEGSALDVVAKDIPLDWSKQEAGWETISETDKKEDFSQRRQFVTKLDNSSNTNYQDFQLLSESAQVPQGLRILEGTSRDINANLVNYVPRILQKIYVDASSMTDDESGGPVEGSLCELRRLFPDFSIANLEAMLEACNGDVNWASNCLLDKAPGVRLDISSLPRSRTPSPEVSAPEETSLDVSSPVVPAVKEAHPSTPAKTDCSDVILPEQQPTSLNRSLSDDSLNVACGESVAVRKCSSVPSVCDPSSVTSVVINTPKKSPATLRPPTPNKRYPRPNSLEDDVPETSEESEASSQDEDEMLEFVISPEFSQQLFSRFGGPQNKVRKSGKKMFSTV